MLKKFRFLGLALVFALAVVLVACGGDDGDNANENENNNEEEQNDQEEQNDENNEGEETAGLELGETDLTITYVAWAGELLRTPMVEIVLEEAGYNVDAKQVEAGAMWSSVADGSADFMTGSWLPATHKSYWEEYGDDVEVVATFVEAAPLALTVPSYVEDINSIEDLKDNDEFGDSVDWTIIGIDPGAGIMESTEDALEHYGLDKWELQESSEGAMLTELQTKMDNEEPIIVPLWEPHWAFNDLDLKMLEDPDEIFGGEGDQIQAIGKEDFAETSPAAYEILQRFAEDYSGDIENELLVKVNEGATEEEVAQEYLDENPDLLEAWLEGIE